MPVDIPTSLDDILASLGLTEYSDLFGGRESIADYYGLPEGADYSQFFTDFPSEKLEDILSGLPDYAREQYGFVTGQYNVGKKAAGERFRGGRENILEKMRSTLPGLREKTGGFAGGLGIKDAIERFRRSSANKFTGMKETTSTMLQDLLQSKQRGMSSAEQNVLGKVGGVESLVANWLDSTRSQATYLKGLDPTGLNTLLGLDGDTDTNFEPTFPLPDNGSVISAPAGSGLAGIFTGDGSTRVGTDGKTYRLSVGVYNGKIIGYWFLVETSGGGSGGGDSGGGDSSESKGSGGGGSSGFGIPDYSYYSEGDAGDTYPYFSSLTQ